MLATMRGKWMILRVIWVVDGNAKGEAIAREVCSGARGTVAIDVDEAAEGLKRTVGVVDHS